MSKATHHNLNSSEMQNVTLQELADFKVARDNWAAEWDAWAERYDPNSSENPQAPRPPRPPFFAGWLGEE